MKASDVDALPRLAGSLDESAKQIDRIFAVAGAQLGQGLSVFETLKGSLSELSQELGGPELRQASAALYDLSSELDALGDQLPEETSILAAIASESSAATGSLEKLLGSMRLIAILARSARIEAASLPWGSEEFGDFANEIVTLASRAQVTVETCARDHAGLAALLGCALSAQRDFERQYRGTLITLAGDLRSTIAQVELRQRESLARMEDAARHSSQVAIAAGSAIMALQSGDAIRQRLEHALIALRLAMGEASGGKDPLHQLSDSDRIFLTMILLHILERQLDAAGQSLEQDVLGIDRSLLILADETAALMSLNRSLYGSSGASSGSFISTLESDLAEAADLIAKCQVARSGVELVTRSLANSFGSLDQTIATLGDTVDSIQLIGTNASLRAARLGQDGRSLVIVAQELKAAASDVARNAGRLKPVFLVMQQAGQGLRHGGGDGDGDIRGLDQTMQRSLGSISSSGMRLGTTLMRLSSEGASFARVVGEARLMFSNAAAAADVMRGGAIISARSRSDISDVVPDDPDTIRAILRNVVRGTYTMAAERDILDRCLIDLRLIDSVSSEENSHHSECEDIDDFVF